MITIATHAASAVERDERDERRDDQQLVGDRVHQLAERRDRVARAREVAVEQVGERRDREHDRREQVPARRRVEQRDDEHRHEQDAQDRQDVGDVDREHRGGASRRAVSRAPPRRPRVSARAPAPMSESRGGELAGRETGDRRGDLPLLRGEIPVPWLRAINSSIASSATGLFPQAAGDRTRAVAEHRRSVGECGLALDRGERRTRSVEARLPGERSPGTSRTTSAMSRGLQWSTVP